MSTNIFELFENLFNKQTDYECDIRAYCNNKSSNEVFEIIDESGEEIDLSLVEGELNKVEQ